MFCNNCGNKLPPGAAFCNSCGNQIGEKEAASAPTGAQTSQWNGAAGSAPGASAAHEPGPQQQPKKKSKKKRIAIIGGLVCVAALLVAVLVVVPYAQKSSAYNDAVTLFESGQYERAYTALSGLPEDFKDVSALRPRYHRAYGAVVLGSVELGGYDWRVLDVNGGQVLLLSEHILEQRAYHDTFTDITWEGCGLRAYLNGEFYNRFTEEERERITETQVTNADNPWYGTSGGNATSDKIFLLSLDEVVQYFGDSGQLGNRPGNSINDQYNAARIARDTNGNAPWWWLRSPGLYSLFAVGVDGGGRVIDGGGRVDVGGINVDADEGGVRPALWLNL